MKYNRTTRILHFLIVVTVCSQLLSQFWMFVPTPDELPKTHIASWLFVCHLLVGVMALCFIAVRLLCVMDHEEESRRLFPWTAKKQLLKMWSDIQKIPQWLKVTPPSPDEHNSLASAVHGLGLLLIMGLGLTGIMFYMGMEPDGGMDGLTRLFRSVHDVLGVVLWVYMFGHVMMLGVHLWFKQSSILQIFRFKQDEDD